MSESYHFGKKGEESAKLFVQNLGYQILEVNWRIFHYEIDIIAMDHHELVIIEVKSRKSKDYDHPGEFISRKKAKNLIAAADYYIHEKSLSLEVRFDLITVFPTDHGFEIEHFKDAFNALS